VVSTGNSLDYCQQDWDQMHASEAAVKEMEAAGIAWAAALHGTPLLALKAITDIVDGDRPAQEEFLENLAAAAKALQARAWGLGFRFSGGGAGLAAWGCGLALQAGPAWGRVAEGAGGLAEALQARGCAFVACASGVVIACGTCNVPCI
jgi:hypothetical protein